MRPTPPSSATSSSSRSRPRKGGARNNASDEGFETTVVAIKEESVSIVTTPTHAGAPKGMHTSSSSRPPVVRSNNNNKPQQFWECDYDVSPTELYQAIEARQWTIVERMLEADDDSDDSDEDDSDDEDANNNKKKKVTMARQAATWVVRKEPNGRLRWRLLPVHAAIIFQAPATVVDLLLEEFPGGAAAKDDQGMLPLHLAVRNKPVNWALVEDLLTAYPAGVFVKDRKGRTPIQGGLAAAAACKQQDRAQEEHKAALQTLDLYLNIYTAGEKTRWEAETKDATEARISGLAEQHAHRLTQLREEFTREQRQVKQQHEHSLANMQQQIQQQHQRNQVLQEAYESLQREQHSSTQLQQHYARELELKQENQTLHHMVRTLLNQQRQMASSIDELDQDLGVLHDRRNQLLSQYMEVNEAAFMTSQAHTSVWKENMQATWEQFESQLGEATANTETPLQRVMGTDTATATTKEMLAIKPKQAEEEEQEWSASMQERRQDQLSEEEKQVKPEKSTDDEDTDDATRASTEEPKEDAPDEEEEEIREVRSTETSNGSSPTK